MTLSRCKCQKAPFAAIAQNFGREGLHIMTACIRSVHEGCGTRHITVDGADDDLRNALAIASDGVHRGQSGALSVASPASVSLQTRERCGSGRLRPATDRTEPGERQGRRGGELTGWGVGTCACRSELPKSVLFAAIAQNLGRQGLHIMTAPIALVHEGCGTRHITVDGADSDLRKALTIARQGVHRDNLEASSWHHEPV